jgi:hypothetical protein
MDITAEMRAVKLDLDKTELEWRVLHIHVNTKTTLLILLHYISVIYIWTADSDVRSIHKVSRQIPYNSNHFK